MTLFYYIYDECELVDRTNLTEELSGKIKKNGEKYPVEKSKGTVNNEL